MSFLPAELIKKKRDGNALTNKELEFLITQYVSGELPDYQMAAWLMAVYFQGMTSGELACFTELMLNSGRTMDFSFLKAPRVDKHSTGGVGDKTSLIIGPIMAAAQVHIPMIAGRGLGHTGGTLDKLESIPGFNVDLSYEAFQKNVSEHYLALISQTDDICPADKKLYALRDVTSTVASLPLICGSIMSKKLAEDLTHLVLDVKFGSGAFMKDFDQAEALARLLMTTGEHHNVQVVALLTNMDQPLGRFIGNALEVKECLDIMRGENFVEEGYDYYKRTRELSLQLSAYMLYVAKKGNSPEEAYELAKNILDSGKAYDAFLNLCQYQGPADINKLPEAKIKKPVLSPSTGYIEAINVEEIGWASVRLGAGRKKSTDPIDYASGFESNIYLGKQVSQGDPLFYIYTNNEQPLKEIEQMVLNAIQISKEPSQEPALIQKILLPQG